MISFVVKQLHGTEVHFFARASEGFALLPRPQRRSGPQPCGHHPFQMKIYDADVKTKNETVKGHGNIAFAILLRPKR